MGRKLHPDFLLKIGATRMIKRHKKSNRKIDDGKEPHPDKPELKIED
jgi:hypothetical protein